MKVLPKSQGGLGRKMLSTTDYDVLKPQLELVKEVVEMIETLYTPEHKPGTTYVNVDKMPVNYIHSQQHSGPQGVHLDGVADFGSDYLIHTNTAGQPDKEQYFKVRR